MDVNSITADWLKTQKWQVQKPNVVTIDGVVLKELNVVLDGRGDVTELWSEKWLDAGAVHTAHAYQSATDYGVVKSWHLHDIHTDQFTVTRGKLQVSLADIREGSPTFGHVNTVVMGTTKPRFLKIPNGILHGWKSLAKPETLVINFQSHVYDPADEFKFPWDTVLTEIWQPING